MTNKPSELRALGDATFAARRRFRAHSGLRG
jgi:hypothetical protein